MSKDTIEKQIVFKLLELVAESHSQNLEYSDTDIVDSVYKEYKDEPEVKKTEVRKLLNSCKTSIAPLIKVENKGKYIAREGANGYVITFKNEKPYSILYDLADEAIDYYCGPDQYTKAKISNKYGWPEKVVKALLEITETTHQTIRVSKRTLQNTPGDEIIEKIVNRNIYTPEKFKEKLKDKEVNVLQKEVDKYRAMEYYRLTKKERNIVDFIEAHNEAQKLIEPLEMNYEVKKTRGTKPGMGYIPDLHLGIEVGNGWNSNNLQETIRRVKQYINKCIKEIKTNNLKTFHLVLLGDLINGNIHKSIEQENRAKVIEQVQIVKMLIAHEIEKLAKEVEELKTYFVPGNHGRTDKNKKDSIDKENFEFMYWDGIKDLCRNLKNVEFVKNTIDSEMAIIDFGKGAQHKYIAVHGSKFGKHKAKNLPTMLNFVPAGIIQGHGHHTESKSVNNVKEIMVPDMVGTNEHSKNMGFASYTVEGRIDIIDINEYRARIDKTSMPELYYHKEKQIITKSIVEEARELIER